MKVTIAITGSLRDREQLGQVVDGAFALRDRCPWINDIRLSTTDSQDDVGRGIKKWNGRGELQVIRSSPPSIIVKGHRLHQLCQLDAALEGLASDVWVMKLRTDKLVLPVDLIKSCIERVAADPSAHDGKFGVLEGHVFLPWYLNDMAFFAQAGSLREIVSFDVTADVFAPGLATEQVIWSRLLGAEVRSFFKSARLYPQCHELRLEQRDGHDNGIAFQEIRAELHRYWRLLNSRFFSMAGHRFKEPYSLRVGDIDLTSDSIFSRYGEWGASFTDPKVCERLLQQVDVGQS
jgi:hypothetical protein